MHKPRNHNSYFRGYVQRIEKSILSLDVCSKQIPTGKSPSLKMKFYEVFLVHFLFLKLLWCFQCFVSPGNPSLWVLRGLRDGGRGLNADFSSEFFCFSCSCASQPASLVGAHYTRNLYLYNVSIKSSWDHLLTGREGLSLPSFSALTFTGGCKRAVT